MMIKKNNVLYAGIGLVVLLLMTMLYAHPLLSGKELIQHDIVQYKGGAKELLDYRAEHNKETYWSDAMFGGMPTYQTGVQFRGDLIKQLDNLLNFLPKPANYFFLLFSGFFLLGWVATKKWTYALLGAVFFGWSTYFYIVVAAGHNGKLHTIVYFAPLLAGILLVYIRRNYTWGFITTSLAMGLQVVANHPQMTYYLFMALGILFLSELIRAIIKKTEWKHFGISSLVLASAFILGIGMNSQRLMANAEYVKETVRGKQILTNKTQKSGDSGLDKESLTLWSYGKLETLNLFIPRLMGGSSQEKESEKMMLVVQELVQEHVGSQQEYDNIQKGLSSLTYWGDQPGTSGPAYQGAVVVFLAILGFFFTEKRYRYWILASSILCITLAWGSNFPTLTDFFIDFVPFYNKFRAPSSILVLVELLFPLIAMVGLFRFFNNKGYTEQYRRKRLIYVAGSLLGVILLLILFGKSFLGFQTEREKEFLPPYLMDYLVQERFSMFKVDAIKAMFYVGVTTLVLYLGMKNKISQNITLVIIGLVSILDLWLVNQRYLNEDHYTDKMLSQNPFQTESSDLFIEKSENNSFVATLLSQVKVNKTLETISEKDKSHYKVFNTVLSPFNENNTSYYKSSIGGYSAAKLRRYDDVINTYFMKQDSIKLPKILNMLNAKYVLVGNLEEPELVPNPYANGNAWLVSNVQFAKNANEEIQQIGVIDSKTTAVVSSEDRVYFQGKPLLNDPTASIELKKYQANELEFISKSKTPQLAVFSEIYYPHGWKVFLDEKEVPYIKANYLLRSVYLPAGNHNIRMAFEPEVIQKGKLFSMASMEAFILLSVAGIWLSKRRKNKSKTI